MDRLEERPLALPTALVFRHQSIIEHQPHIGYGRHHCQPAMGVLHGHRVVVVIKPDQRLRIRGALPHASRLERLFRQRQERRLVLPQKLHP